MKQIIFTVINDLNYDQRMVRICSSLQQNQYRCLLVGRVLPQSEPLVPRGYEQHRLKCFFNKGKLFYIEYNFRLLFYLFFKKCDAICSIDIDTAIPGIWVSRMKKKKHIFDAHEIFTHVPEVINRHKVQRFWQKVQRYVFLKTGFAYTVGEELAKWFREQYGRDVEVVRNIPELKKQLPYEPDPDKYILYQGALNKGRGLEILIEAMVNIPCRLVLAGDGDVTGELKKLVIHFGLQDKVQFLGFVLPADLPRLTARAWLGMNVSENAGLSYYLSLNNKFFDYMHAGLPSLINAFPEYILLNNKHHVGVITDSVVSNIVQNVNLLLNDPKLHATLSENCLKASLELNWENESAHLLNLYNRYFEQK